MRERRDEPVDLSGAALADGDLQRWLPPVALADLAGNVGRELATLGEQELGADLLQVVLEDRDPPP